MTDWSHPEARKIRSRFKAAATRNTTKGRSSLGWLSPRQQLASYAEAMGWHIIHARQVVQMHRMDLDFLDETQA